MAQHLYPWRQRGRSADYMAIGDLCVGAGAAAVIAAGASESGTLAQDE